MLDIEQHRVGVAHQFLKLSKPRFPSCEWLCRCVETGVDAPFVSLAEKLSESAHLEQRLSTTHRDATLVPPVGAIPCRLVDQVIDRNGLSHARLP